VPFSREKVPQKPWSEAFYARSLSDPFHSNLNCSNLQRQTGFSVAPASAVNVPRENVAFAADPNKILDKLKRYGVKGQRIQPFLLAVQNLESSLLEVYVFNAEAAYFACSQADFHGKPDKQVVAEATMLPSIIMNF
jgi:hypothetical protein